jgi:hypothetical protein
MTGCSNNCAALTPSAGQGFIIKGGSAYHLGNSSATPYIAGGWNWQWAGTSSHQIYVGVDPAWPSTGWTRPVFTGDNPICSSTSCSRGTYPYVSSCQYQVTGGNNLIAINPSAYLTFDNLELTGMCWTGTPSGTNDIYLYSQGLSSGSGGVNSSSIVSNMYIHGWSHTSGAAYYATAMRAYTENALPIYEFDVVDGWDSDDQVMDAVGDQSAGVYIVQYNVFRHFGGSNAPNNCHIVHDNLFEYVNNCGENGDHCDTFMCYGETSNGSTDPNLFYNNIFRYIGTEYSSANSDGTLWIFPTLGQTDYVFNNVAHDIYSPANYFSMNQNNHGAGGNAALYNNTWVCPCDFGNDSPANGTWSLINNHWVTTATSTSGTFQNPSSVTSETNSLYMSPTGSGSAAAQGYTSANDYAPTSSTNSTVTASGTNDTTFCNGLTNVLAKAACLQGFTGVAYNATNHTVVVPAILGVNRPSTGAWNVGAYQFAATGPNAPTGLTVTVH